MRSRRCQKNGLHKQQFADLLNLQTECISLEQLLPCFSVHAHQSQFRGMIPLERIEVAHIVIGISYNI